MPLSSQYFFPLNQFTKTPQLKKISELNHKHLDNLKLEDNWNKIQDKNKDVFYQTLNKKININEIGNFVEKELNEFESLKSDLKLKKEANVLILGGTKSINGQIQIDKFKENLAPQNKYKSDNKFLKYQCSKLKDNENFESIEKIFIENEKVLIMDIEEIQRTQRRNQTKDLLSKPEECLLGLLNESEKQSQIIFAWSQSDISRSLLESFNIMSKYQESGQNKTINDSEYKNWLNNKMNSTNIKGNSTEFKDNDKEINKTSSSDNDSKSIDSKNNIILKANYPNLSDYTLEQLIQKNELYQKQINIFLESLTELETQIPQRCNNLTNQDIYSVCENYIDKNNKFYSTEEESDKIISYDQDIAKIQMKRLALDMNKQLNTFVTTKNQALCTNLKFRMMIITQMLDKNIDSDNNIIKISNINKLANEHQNFKKACNLKLEEEKQSHLGKMVQLLM